MYGLLFSSFCARGCKEEEQGLGGGIMFCCCLTRLGFSAFRSVDL